MLNRMKVTNVNALPEPGQAFQMVIVYEDEASARRALDTSELLLREVGDICVVQTNSWKVNLLAHPRIRAHSAAAARAADAVIISVAERVPTGLIHWVESWLSQPSGHRAALIALFDPEHDGDADADRARLRQIALRAGVDFFGEAPATSSFLASSVKAHKPLFPAGVTETMLPRPSLDGWGLNE